MPATLAADGAPWTLGPGGALPEVLFRSELAIVRGPEHVLVRFAHWELRLPSSAVTADPEVDAIITQRRATGVPASPFARGLLTLMKAQGCLLASGEDRLSLRQVFDLVQPLRSHLYASYYAHPLWGLLRRGEASHGQVAAWVIHNYHVSRSAGVIAARMATRFRTHPLGDSFRRDALEEFWHCDRFYFVRHPNLTLDEDLCKRYVALPGSLAFEELALRAASEDWLGHLLIAYFQESSIVFRTDSEAFYDVVERNYGLDGFFSGWRRHLSLDADQGHADALEALFSTDIEVTRDELAGALRSLQLAHFFLTAALDQAHEFEGDAAAAISDRQPARVIAGQHAKGPIRLDPATLQSVVQALREGSFEALAHARAHDEIMAAGRLAAALQDVPTCAGDGVDPWLRAARNFIVERSPDGPTLYRIACEVDRLAEISNSSLPALRAAVRTADHDANSGSTLAFAQLRELLELGAGACPLTPWAFDAPAARQA